MQSLEKYLLVPAPNNHFQTLQLLALAAQKGNEAYILRINTDTSADRSIYQLAKSQGVRPISQEEALAQDFDSIYVHSWTHDKSFLEKVRVEKVFAYGDGLSNRFRLENLQKHSGLVFWGQELFDPSTLPLAVNGLEYELVHSSLVRAQWQALFESSDLEIRELQKLSMGFDLLIAFRYWGSSIYAGIGKQEVEEYLADVISESSKSDTILVAEDFRWDNKFEQLDLVKRVAPSSRIIPLRFPERIRRHFGHLATLDLLAFVGGKPDFQVAAFDGSVALTYMLTSGDPKVALVIPPKHEPRLPGDFLALQNINSHLEIANQGHFSLPTLLNLTSSSDLTRSIEFQARVLSLDERTELVRRQLRDFRPPDTLESIDALLSKVRSQGRSVSRLSRALAKVRSSKLAKRVFYMTFTNKLVAQVVRKLKKWLLR